jgi:hypothetical protein
LATGAPFTSFVTVPRKYVSPSAWSWRYSRRIDTLSWGLTSTVAVCELTHDEGQKMFAARPALLRAASS